MISILPSLPTLLIHFQPALLICVSLPSLALTRFHLSLCMYPILLPHTLPAEFAPLPELAHLLCATSLVCLHHLAYPRRGTLGLHLSSASTSHSHCVQHNVSVIVYTVMS